MHVCMYVWLVLGRGLAICSSCVCMHVCVCICIYIYIYIYIYMSSFMYIYTCIPAYACLCVYMYTYIHTYTCNTQQEVASGSLQLHCNIVIRGHETDAGAPVMFVDTAVTAKGKNNTEADWNMNSKDANMKSVKDNTEADSNMNSEEANMKISGEAKPGSLAKDMVSCTWMIFSIFFVHTGSMMSRISRYSCTFLC
jgi:hypothetical protein